VRSPGKALARNDYYRRLFIARTVSNLGNGISPIALSFGVLALPGADASTLSIVLAAQAIPVVLLLPVGGVIADRLGNARVIGVTDVMMSVVVAAEAALFISGRVSMPILVGLSVLTGVLIALWYPAFPGLVPDVVVAEKHLQPANAYISVGSNAGLILGNAVGGILVATLGVGIALAVDATTFLVAGLLVISFRHVSKPHVSGESMLGDLAHGWRLVVSIRWFVVVVLAFSVIVMALRGAEEVMGPVLALQEYGGAAGWAIVMGFMSMGLLVGAFTASRIRVRRPMLFGMVVTLTLPLWMVTLAFALPLPVVSLGAFAWGMAIELFQVNWFTTLQTHIPRESIARVSSYDAMGSLLLGPVGLALAGPLVAAVGLQTSFLIAAAVCLTAILASLGAKSIWQLRAQSTQESLPPAVP
jgi:MFS family permease